MHNHHQSITDLTATTTNHSTTNFHSVCLENDNNNPAIRRRSNASISSYQSVPGSASGLGSSQVGDPSAQIWQHLQQQRQSEPFVRQANLLAKSSMTTTTAYANANAPASFSEQQTGTNLRPVKQSTPSISSKQAVSEKANISNTITTTAEAFSQTSLQEQQQDNDILNALDNNKNIKLDSSTKKPATNQIKPTSSEQISASAHLAAVLAAAASQVSSLTASSTSGAGQTLNVHDKSMAQARYLYSTLTSNATALLATASSSATATSGSNTSATTTNSSGGQTSGQATTGNQSSGGAGPSEPSGSQASHSGAASKQTINPSASSSSSRSSSSSNQSSSSPKPTPTRAHGLGQRKQAQFVSMSSRQAAHIASGIVAPPTHGRSGGVSPCPEESGESNESGDSPLAVNSKSNQQTRTTTMAPISTNNGTPTTTATTTTTDDNDNNAALESTSALAGTASAGAVAAAGFESGDSSGNDDSGDDQDNDSSNKATHYNEAEDEQLYLGRASRRSSRRDSKRSELEQELTSVIEEENQEQQQQQQHVSSKGGQEGRCETPSWVVEYEQDYTFGGSPDGGGRRRRSSGGVSEKSHSNYGSIDGGSSSASGAAATTRQRMSSVSTTVAIGTRSAPPQTAALQQQQSLLIQPSMDPAMHALWAQGADLDTGNGNFIMATRRRRSVHAIHQVQLHQIQQQQQQQQHHRHHLSTMSSGASQVSVDSGLLGVAASKCYKIEERSGTTPSGSASPEAEQGAHRDVSADSISVKKKLHKLRTSSSIDEQAAQGRASQKYRFQAGGAEAVVNRGARISFGGIGSNSAPLQTTTKLPVTETSVLDDDSSRDNATTMTKNNKSVELVSPELEIIAATQVEAEIKTDSSREKQLLYQKPGSPSASKSLFEEEEELEEEEEGIDEEKLDQQQQQAEEEQNEEDKQRVYYLSDTEYELDELESNTSMLASLFDWNYPIFELHERYGDSILSKLSYRIFFDSGFFNCK